jgi:hypothetical protein
MWVTEVPIEMESMNTRMEKHIRIAGESVDKAARALQCDGDSIAG